MKQNIKAIILGLIVVVGVAYASAAWTPAPSDGPANAATNNTPAPINVSGSAQIKTGSLTLGGLGVGGDFTFLPTGVTSVIDGQVLTADGTTGKVKWGSITGGGGAAGFGYEVECYIYGNNYCFRLDKNSGVIMKASAGSGNSYTGTINWANATTFSGIPVFGTAPYALTLDHINTSASTLCLSDSSGVTKCVSGNPL